MSGVQTVGQTSFVVGDTIKSFTDKEADGDEWLVCDGRELFTTEYNELYDEIGVIYTPVLASEVTVQTGVDQAFTFPGRGIYFDKNNPGNVYVPMNGFVADKVLNAYVHSSTDFGKTLITTNISSADRTGISSIAIGNDIVCVCLAAGIPNDRKANVYYSKNKGVSFSQISSSLFYRYPSIHFVNGLFILIAEEVSGTYSVLKSVNGIAFTNTGIKISYNNFSSRDVVYNGKDYCIIGLNKVVVIDKNFISSVEYDAPLYSYCAHDFSSKNTISAVVANGLIYAYNVPTCKMYKSADCKEWKEMGYNLKFDDITSSSFKGMMLLTDKIIAIAVSSAYRLIDVEKEIFIADTILTLGQGICSAVVKSIKVEGGKAYAAITHPNATMREVISDSKVFNVPKVPFDVGYTYIKAKE